MPTIRTILPQKNTDVPILRVAAYCRVSSDSEDQQHSFGVQTEYYTKLIGENPLWTLADIYADEGITGTSMKKRDEFNRMIADCKRGKIDRILTKSVSRFARNTVDCLETVRMLSGLGISVLFEKEQIDTATMSSEVLLGFMSTQAQDESTSISGNMRWSYEKRMKSGNFLGYQAPYGYNFVDKKLYINEEEAAVVRRIFQMFLSGSSTRDIVAALESEGIPHLRKQLHWDRCLVRYILHNERYTGDALLQKTFTTETLPHRIVKNKGERAKYYVENSHDAIISREEFQQVQMLLGKRTNASTQMKHGLSGLVFCPSCGHPLRRIAVKEKHFWICRYAGEDACNSNLRIDESELMAAAERVIRQLSKYRDVIISPLIRRMERLSEKTNHKQQKMYEISSELAKVNSQILVLTQLQSSGILDAADFFEQNRILVCRQSQLRSQRTKLLSGDDAFGIMSQLHELEDTLEENVGAEILLEDASAFTLIRKIVPRTSTEVDIHILGGLVLKEQLPDIKRRCKRQ